MDATWTEDSVHLPCVCFAGIWEGHLLLGSPGVSQPLLDSPTQPFVMGDSDNQELSTGRSLSWNGPAQHPDLTDVLACTEMVYPASPFAGCKRGFMSLCLLM